MKDIEAKTCVKFMGNVEHFAKLKEKLIVCGNEVSLVMFDFLFGIFIIQINPFLINFHYLNKFK